MSGPPDVEEQFLTDLLRYGLKLGLPAVVLVLMDAAVVRGIAMGVLAFVGWQASAWGWRRWRARRAVASEDAAAFYGDEEIARLVAEHERPDE